MQRGFTLPPMIANGTIQVSTFIKIDPSKTSNHAIACGLGETPIGISQLGPNTFPDASGGATQGPAATVGQTLSYFGPGEIGLLRAGVGGWTPGKYLRSDANGYGILAYPGEFAFAKTFNTANANSYVDVQVIEATVTPPGNGNPVTTYAVDTTLTSSLSGAIVNVTAADIVITLPLVAVSEGVSFMVVANATTAALQAGAVGIKINIPTADDAAVKMFGNGFTAANGKGAVHTKATAIQGDSIVVRCYSGNWYVDNVSGTWAREA